MTKKIERSTSNVQRPTSNGGAAQRPSGLILAGMRGGCTFKHRTLNIQHRASNMGAAQRMPGIYASGCAERVFF